MEWFGILASGRPSNVIPYIARFPEGIAPSSPIDSIPLITFNACLGFEFCVSQRLAIVSLCGSSNFLKNIQFGHRGGE